MQKKRDGRILVVEDEPRVREYMRMVLEAAGHVVAEAACADEALLLLAGDHIRLVICDVELPDGNGLELLTIVGRKWPEKKLVVMSATVLPRVEQLPDGADMLCKPFSEERLLDVVDCE